MRSVVFVGGGRTECRVVRLLRLLRVEAFMFRPIVPIEEVGCGSGEVPFGAVPSRGSVVQNDFDRVFDFYEEQLSFLSSQTSNLERVIGIDSRVTSIEPEELKIALTSRVVGASWEAAFVAHFLGSARTSVVLITRSSRLKAVLRGSLGFRVISFPRLPLRKLWSRLRVDRSSASNKIADADAQKIQPSHEVVVIEHQGSSYARLYRWSQYDEGRSEPEHLLGVLPRLSYSELDYRSLNRSQLVTCLIQTLLASPRALAVVARCRSGMRAAAFVEILRLGFEVRSARKVIKSSYPDLRVSLFAYDMLVPPSLSVALAAEGVWRVATLERPNVHLTGLPILVDDWLVPVDEAPQVAKLSSFVRFRRMVRVGYWRTDFFFAPLKEQREDEIDVLVLPYHVDDLGANDSGDPFTSSGVFEHFIRSVMQLCDRYPELRFLVRAKNDSWVTNPRLGDCVHEMRSLGNLVIDTTYDLDGRSYHLAKSARVVIGKYTSMMEEARSFGKPVVIHNFNQFQSHDFAEGDLGLPWDFFAQNQGRFEDLFREALSKSSSQHGRMEFCDGQVRRRIRLHIETVLTELRGGDQ